MWVIGTVGLIHKQLSQDVLEFVDLNCKPWSSFVWDTVSESFNFQSLKALVCKIEDGPWSVLVRAKKMVLTAQKQTP